MYIKRRWKAISIYSETGDIDQILRSFVSILVGYKYDEAQLRDSVPAHSLFYLLTNSDMSRIATNKLDACHFL